MNTTSELRHTDASNTDSASTADKIVTVVSWLIVGWMCYVFLGSLPYKFTGAPDTVHIFSTIGDWLKGFLGASIGSLFSNYGAYVVGSFELLTSLVLLSPIVYWLKNRARGWVAAGHSRARIHAIGGVMASMVMAGAVFFHLFSPLGIEVLDNGQSDGGSLFRAAVSILILGIVLFFMNRRRGFASRS